MDRTLEEWRDLLLAELRQRRTQFIRPRRYYDGDHVRITAPDNASDDYRRLAELGVTNMCGLIVDTVARRLIPKGIRIGGVNDLEAWQNVWQANGLDGDMQVGFEEALKVGRGPIMLSKTLDGKVRVTIEDPDETIIAYAPGSRRDRVAALKSFCDGDYEDTTVWTETLAMRWTTPLSRTGRPKYAQTESFGEGPQEHGFSTVPVLELRSKPDIKGRPKPEISVSVIRLQDRLNKTMFDAVVGTENGAHPQRYTIGIEIETDADGNAVNPLIVGPNHVWGLQSEGEDPSKAQIGQLDAYDISGLLNLADATIKQMANISTTPVLSMISDLTNVGNDTVRALERGHTDKCRSHQASFDDTLEEMFRLAMETSGLGEPPSDIAIDWEPIETRSPAELADAAIKLHQAGYPFVAIARYMGETQSEINRIIDEKKAEDAIVASQLASGEAIQMKAKIPAVAPA